jgi:hypothetical protein
MDFLSQLLKAIGFVPALVNGIEGLFANKTGPGKKNAAMSFLQNALTVTDAVAKRSIVDPTKFNEGISKIIDGARGLPKRLKLEQEAAGCAGATLDIIA